MSSTVLMRRKQKAKELSKGKSGFSNRGSTRNHYYTGSTGHNSVVRTPHSGSLPRGHGGRCGGYAEHILCNGLMPSATATTANNPSMMTTSGLLSSRVHNITICPDGSCPSYNWVKSFNPLEHSQSNYIHKVKVEAICDDQIRRDAGIRQCDVQCKTSHNTYSKNVTDGAMSSGEYTDTVLYKNNCLPTPACKKPFPMILNRNGCLTEYYTPQEAIDAGLLPADWMNCGAGTTEDVFSQNPY
jgi:hypothetical protein